MFADGTKEIDPHLGDALLGPAKPRIPQQDPGPAPSYRNLDRGVHHSKEVFVILIRIDPAHVHEHRELVEDEISREALHIDGLSVPALETSVDGVAHFVIVDTMFAAGCTAGALAKKVEQIASRADIVENRYVGMKSRGVYETPGGSILYAAHRELESLCHDRDTSHYKEEIALRYAELVYFGKWYHSLRESLQAFIDETQQTITGWVKLKLYKGNIIVAGRYSPNSLYREDFATFGQEDVYDQQDAVGFITLFGLQMKVKAMMEVSDGGKTRYAAPDYSKFKRD